jgi:hypothetical protein
MDLQKLWDPIYLHGPGGVENWLGQFETWVNRNVVARNSFVTGGGDPAHFIPDMFTMDLPKRTVADYDGERGLITQSVVTAPANLFPARVLPDYVPPVQSNPGFTHQGAAIQSAQDAQSATTAALTLENNKMLRAICQQFSIKV